MKSARHKAYSRKQVVKYSIFHHFELCPLHLLLDGELQAVNHTIQFYGSLKIRQIVVLKYTNTTIQTFNFSSKTKNFPDG